MRHCALLFKQKVPPSYPGIHPKQGLRRPFSHSGWEENRRAGRPQKARGEVQGSSILQPVTQTFPNTVSLCEWIRAEKIAHFRRNHHRCHLCQSGKPEGKPISTDTSFAVFSSTSARSAASRSVGKEAIRQTASGNSHTSDCLYVHLQSTRFNGWMLLITGDFRCQSNYKGCSHSSAVPDTIQK